MAFSLPNIVIKPDLVTLFHEDRPLCAPCPKTQEHQSTCVDSWVHRVPENGHQPLGRGNSLWRSACPILWSNPNLLRYFTEIAPSVFPCPKTQELQSTCVDSWVHRVPENGHQPLGREKFTMAFSLPNIVIKPDLSAISRRSPHVYSLALKLRNTKVPVCTHESIGYPKMDISHLDAAIHYGVQLAQYCDQTLTFYAISRILPSPCSLALRLRNTKVPVWAHESIGYPKINISHWDAAIHYGIQLAQYCDQTWSFNAISRRSPPVYSLALRLRNTKVPVWTHESIGYPKMDISHWDAAIHYGVQLAQYCNQTLPC